MGGSDGRQFLSPGSPQWRPRGKNVWHRLHQAVPARLPVDVVEEVFLFSKKDSGYIYNNHELRERGNGNDSMGREHRNVWNIGLSGYRSEHTAAMPLELAARCVLTGSHAGGRVLDPFAGTGTTGVAAKMLARSADLIELNPDYAQIAARRLNATIGPAKAQRPLPPDNQRNWVEWGRDEIDWLCNAYLHLVDVCAGRTLQAKARAYAEMVDDLNRRFGNERTLTAAKFQTQVMRRCDPSIPSLFATASRT
jgi:hypothetical protein